MVDWLSVFLWQNQLDQLLAAHSSNTAMWQETLSQLQARVAELEALLAAEQQKVLAAVHWDGIIAVAQVADAAEAMEASKKTHELELAEVATLVVMCFSTHFSEHSVQCSELLWYNPLRSRKPWHKKLQGERAWNKRVKVCYYQQRKAKSDKAFSVKGCSWRGKASHNGCTQVIRVQPTFRFISVEGNEQMNFTNHKSYL